LDELLDGSRFVGRAPEQVAEFIAEEVDPLLELWAEVPTVRAEVRV
jgi:hypothetical protein